MRPVSDRPAGELANDEISYEDGDLPRQLDILKVPIRRRRDHPFQSENCLIDERFYWACDGRIGWRGLNDLVDQVDGSLWENDSSSSYGLNDRVHISSVGHYVKIFGGSLTLVRVNDFVINLATEGIKFNNPRKRIRGSFSLNDRQYRMAITDLSIENAYFSRPEGDYDIGRAVLCISLGEPFDGHVYKLIAAVHLVTPV